MFSIILPIVLLIVGIVLLGICVSLADNGNHPIFSIACLILGALIVILSIPTIVKGISYFDYTLNSEAYIANVEETRASYVILLEKYGKLSEQDVTSSSAYSELYKNICDFNYEVSRAQAHAGDNFMAGFLYNPAYSTVEPIPLQP